ncbi:mannosyltransferase [Acetobacter pasteurianus NBRC 101655]|uniref:glycosyltransferase family 4 protein n=1 Tax=Acetobacter pasteurianus TaxID=438 RepID=UPI000245704F|nr:glycosyltransferase family 4 protein [Acetobacter pasteurianus]BAU39071.1 mannosyltransferase [Acetobacter pasteurianus NBRC 101655]
MTSSLHPLHHLWRLFPVAQRRRLLAKATALLAPKAASPMPVADANVIIGGELGRGSGLGEGARLLLRGLLSQGVSAKGVEAGLLQSQGKEGLDSVFADPKAALVLHVNAPQTPAALLRLGRKHVLGRRIVGYWVWELPVISPEWQAGVPCVHEIWTPSHFSARALEPLMPGRVKVVPYPLACVPPQPSKLDRQAFGWPEDAVVVLVSFSLASSFERKNPLAAIAAFRQAFGDRKDRLLVMKISGSDHYAADMQRLKDAAGGAQNIRFESRMLPMPDVYAMTQQADIVLSLHRSEGFGLVPAEAMLLERPVIATDWSATSEFLTSDCGWPISYKLVTATDTRGVYQVPQAVWAEADIGCAVEALQTLADDANKRRQLGQAAGKAALRAFGPTPLLNAVAALQK